VTSEPSPPPRRNAARRTIAALAIGGVAVVGVATWRFAAAGAPGVTRLGPDAAVVRGTRRVAGIERVTRARGRGRLPLYLAPAAGPVVDSARVGALAARLVAGTAAGDAPVIALVPRDSVQGLPLAGRLVVTPGEPGLLVFGPAGPGSPPARPR
jgi:hypothetical protein